MRLFKKIFGLFTWELIPVVQPWAQQNHREKDLISLPKEKRVVNGIKYPYDGVLVSDSKIQDLIYSFIRKTDPISKIENDSQFQDAFGAWPTYSAHILKRLKEDYSPQN